MTFSFTRSANELRLPLASGDDDGLRQAQIAAAQAIAAHFWGSKRPAIVVMPTGSGKTAVMVLASLLLRPSRVLVVAPSRLLREQLVEKFKTLEPLRAVRSLTKDAPCPVVLEQKTRVTDQGAWDDLRSADVVIALPHATSPGIDGVPIPPDDLFDLVLVDEAHHAPAPIYRALIEGFPSAKKVLFTATPFRRDEREILGDLIFTYSLAQARRDGVYGQLKFVPVEIDGTASLRARDEAIARAATRQLEADRKAGFNHQLLVRASSKERAADLAEIYRAVTTMKLRLIHSGLSQKWVRSAVRDLRSGALDGIISVDMLGEGFDLPSLKVAALHARHRSLAVTLQFIGRFARTSKEVTLGLATFFAIPDEIERDAEGLYVPGAEWNEIVERLSREQIEGEKQAREFVRTFVRPTFSEGAELRPRYDELSDDDAWRLLRTLKPYFHVKVYDALAEPNLDAPLEVPKGLKPLVMRRSEKHNAFVWVGNQRQTVGWATNADWIDVRHDMFLLVHVPQHRLLFVCASRRENAVYDALVSSALGDKYRRLATAEVNRVLHGIVGAEFFSVGMKNRAGFGGGAESYRMMAGRSADRPLRAADGALYSQGHGFCRGEEDGNSVTVGFSSGSKIWANRRDDLTAFVEWMHAVAAKLRDSRPVVTGSGIDNLKASKRIDAFEFPIVYADLPIDAYARPGVRVRSKGLDPWLVDLSVRIEAQSEKELEFALVGSSLELPFKLTLGGAPLIVPTHKDSEEAVVSGDTSFHDELLQSYLNEHPLVLYLENLARIDGDEQHDPPGRGDSEAIAKQIVPIDWVANGIDPTLEKPRARAKRKSLFEFVEAHLLGTARIIFLDDGAGEIADYVSIHAADETVTVQLFHCKAAKAGDSFPNQQIANLYEVVCQAVKCRRFLDARRLTAQLEHRNTLAACTFKRGDINLTRELLADLSRVVFQVVVVQPALSTEPSEPIARLLEAADAYMRGGNQRPLSFWGTAAK